MQMILTMTGIRSVVAWNRGGGGGRGEAREEREGNITKKLKETFEIKGDVHFPNCGHDFIGVYICQFLPNYKLKNEICNQ